MKKNIKEIIIVFLWAALGALIGIGLSSCSRNHYCPAYGNVRPEYYKQFKK